MASSIHSFFFKAENSILTVEAIREAGYLAGETSTGFIEVTFWDAWLNFKNETLQERFNYNQSKKTLLAFLIAGMKENTPPLMHLSSSTFGGGFDDQPELKAYLDVDTKQVGFDNFQKDSEAEKLFSKYYPDADQGYFNTVDFARDTSDYETEEQKQSIKEARQELENQAYQDWLDSQETLDPTALGLKAIGYYEEKTAVFGRLDYNREEKINEELRFIKRKLMEE